MTCRLYVYPYSDIRAYVQCFTAVLTPGQRYSSDKYHRQQRVYLGAQLKECIFECPLKGYFSNKILNGYET